MLMVWEPGTSKNRSAPLSKQERISRNSERIFQPQKLLPPPGINKIWVVVWTKKYMFQIFFKSSLQIKIFQLKKQTHRSSHHRNHVQDRLGGSDSPIRRRRNQNRSRVVLSWGSWKVQVFLPTFTWQHLGSKKNDEGISDKDPYLGWVSGWKLVYN